MPARVARVDVKVDDVLGRLERVRRAGAGWSARCPAHDDRNNSLSVAEGSDGRVLVRCHAGCSFGDIVIALGMEAADLSSTRGGRTDSRDEAATGQQTVGCTLPAYAEEKQLPVAFLRTLGLDEISLAGRPAVRIPYIDPSGTETAVRFRTALAGDARFCWRRGTKPALYGLNRLSSSRELGYVILVEGESDAQTLWLYGYPALGLPGANQWKEDRDAQYFAELATVYVFIEPDQGGETMLAWIQHSTLRDQVRLVTVEGVKDISELYLADPDTFVDRLEAALQSATPWKEREQLERQLQSEQAWQQCAALAQEENILERFAADLARTGLAGEQENAKLLFLVLVSRFLERPISVAVKGPSAGGKSHLVEAVLRFFPDAAHYTLTAMSERALAYSSEPLRHRFLVLFEAAGMDSEFMSYLVRSLLSEGRIRYETIQKGPNGLEPRLIEREGPTGLIVTTTAVALHPENETRMLSITITDTPEQTRSILRALASTQRTAIATEWSALQAWLVTAEHRVTIPYAERLADLVPPVAVRLRRDFGALLNLIRAHALLHQATRERDDQGRVLASIDDYAAVRELVVDVVSDGIGASVPATIRETVDVVAGLATDDGISITALATALGIDKSAASRRWAAARTRGHLRNLETNRGRPARIVVADPLPDDVEVLPLAHAIAECCADAGMPGEHHPPPVRIADVAETRANGTLGALEENEHGIVDTFATMGAEPVQALLPGRVVEHIEGQGIVVECVEVGGPLCRFPQHRSIGLDWHAPEGFLVCGVCHPRPRTADERT